MNRGCARDIGLDLLNTNILLWILFQEILEIKELTKETIYMISYNNAPAYSTSKISKYPSVRFA